MAPLKHATTRVVEHHVPPILIFHGREAVAPLKRRMDRIKSPLSERPIFHGREAVAPLKPEFEDRKVIARGILFHGREAVAPLKHRRRPTWSQPPGSRIFPRPRGRGPIEATDTRHDPLAAPYLFPRPTGRGPIEALSSVAASLRRPIGFHVRQDVAPLKQLGPPSSLPYSNTTTFPRPTGRGPIEASHRLC